MVPLRETFMHRLQAASADTHAPWLFVTVRNITLAGTAEGQLTWTSINKGEKHGGTAANPTWQTRGNRQSDDILMRQTADDTGDKLQWDQISDLSPDK